MEIINKYLWLVTSSIIIITSIIITIKEKFPQLRIIKIIKSIKSKSNNNISVIESLMISLASRIGVGSIAGIALAIKYGGIGSIFWIWIITILISSITYIESYYGSRYKNIEKETSKGGPHYYIDKILNKKKLAKIYAFLMIISYGIGFITIQTNTISVVTNLSTNININIVNITICIICVYCLYSNTKNKSQLVSKIVPFMTIFYLLLGLYIIIKNNNIILTIIVSIIKEAFGFKSVTGSLIYTLIIGMQRAIFSTEVAIGTSAISASMANGNDNNQGYIQILGNYITTFIICTTTALIILSSNYNQYINLTTNGIELALFAFDFHFKTLGKIFIWIFIFLFSISTVISGFYYGETSLEYITKSKKIKSIYKIIIIIAIFISTYLSAQKLWTLIDVTVAILCLINIYAIMTIYKKLDN